MPHMLRRFRRNKTCLLIEQIGICWLIVPKSTVIQQTYALILRK